MIKKLFFSIFLVTNLLLSSTFFGQAIGDFRSNVAAGNWTTLASWQYYNGTSWVTATYYPGTIGQVTGAVLIQAGNIITMGTANLTTSSMGTLTISGELILDGGGDGGVFTVNTQSIIVTPGLTPYANISFANKVTLALPANATIQVGIGGLPTPGNGTCNNNIEISIGSNVLAYCVGTGSPPAAYNFQDLINNGGFNILSITPSSASSCGSGSFSFTASAIPAAAATIRWYDAPTGGNLLQTGVMGSSNTYSTGVISTTTTYYAEATIGAFTTPRKAVVATINPLPSAPIVGVITQPTCGTATGSVALSGLPSSGTWTLTRSPGAIITTGTGTSTTISGLASGTYTYTVSNGTCTSVASGNVVINAQPGTPVTPTISSYTLPTFADNDGTITLSNLPAGSWVGHQIKDDGTTITTTNISGTGSPYTITGLSMGSYEFEVIELCTSPRSAPAPLTVVPYTPIISAATAINCTGFTANWPATPTATYYQLDVSTVSNFATFVSGYHDLNVGNVLSKVVTGMPVGTLYYRIRARNSTQISLYSATITVTPVTNIYTGTWSAGSPPTNGTQHIVFSAGLTVSTDLSGCSCTVNSGNVIISSGKTLTITNEVKVLGGSLTFENNSSLVQINDAAINFGDIFYKRSTTTAREKDYTYWSSPVIGQTLGDVSPDTPADKFYSFDPVADDWAHESTSKVMDFGIGYIIRAPDATLMPPGFFEALFQGVPNNGAKTITGFVLDNTYLLGNPYPSAMSANAFLAANPVLYGTIYFWTHNTAPVIGAPNGGTGSEAYTGNDFASYNSTGGVAALSGGAVPSGKIAAGQGFITFADANGSVVFNNSMRIAGNNDQFFKQSNKTKSRLANVVEQNRIWLNLTNTEGLFKQTLVGYVTGATNGIDKAYDGESLDANQYADFYSIQDDKNLTIQGRALPFEATDEVSLGYRSAIAGQLSIKIDQTDGILTSQDVFIEDKLTKVIHNLKQSPYQFTTAIGTFDDRFVLRYTNASSTAKTLSTNDLKILDNLILVSNKKRQINITSSIENIDKIMIYDLLGRQIYKKTNIDSNEFSISNLNTTQQTIIVKVALKNGTSATQKIVY